MTDPYSGLPSKSPFPPNPFEVKQECERIADEEWRREQRAEALRKQIAARTEHPAITYQREGVAAYQRDGDITVRPATIARPDPEPADATRLAAVERENRRLRQRIIELAEAERKATDEAAIREVWRDFAAGKIDEAEAQRRDKELRLPRGPPR